MTSNSEARRGPSDLPTLVGARWNLILGAPERPAAPSDIDDADRIAQALDGIYGPETKRSVPRARVLERLRQCDVLEGVLPDEAWRLARQDALGPSGLMALLDQPSRLRPMHLTQIEPTPTLIGHLLRVADRVPEDTRAAVRAKVDRLVQQVSALWAPALRDAVTAGSGARGSGRRQAGARLDLPRTLRHNLRHYDLGKQRLGIERLYFHPANPAPAAERVIIALDSSGSMEEARLYGVLVASVLAKLPHVDPRLLLFDTRVEDVSAELGDPVGLLLRTRPGGGTDLGAAVAHATRLVEDPGRSLLVLISDFEPGGSIERFLDGLRNLSERGVGLLCLRPPDGPDHRGSGETWSSALEALGPVHACAPEDLAGPLASVLTRRRRRR